MSKDIEEVVGELVVGDDYSLDTLFGAIEQIDGNAIFESEDNGVKFYPVLPNNDRVDTNVISGFEGNLNIIETITTEDKFFSNPQSTNIEYYYKGDDFSLEGISDIDSSGLRTSSATFESVLDNGQISVTESTYVETTETVDKKWYNLWQGRDVDIQTTNISTTSGNETFHIETIKRIDGDNETNEIVLTKVDNNGNEKRSNRS